MRSSCRTWLWALAMPLGVFLGPAQSASRSLMARLAPPHLTAEFFGLYTLSGKATAFVGPFAYGLVTGITGNQRFGLATIIVFILAGLVLLLPVRAPALIHGTDRVSAAGGGPSAFVLLVALVPLADLPALLFLPLPHFVQRPARVLALLVEHLLPALGVLLLAPLLLVLALFAHLLQLPFGTAPAPARCPDRRRARPASAATSASARGGEGAARGFPIHRPYLCPCSARS